MKSVYLVAETAWLSRLSQTLQGVHQTIFIGLILSASFDHGSIQINWLRVGPVEQNCSRLD
ncbi:hypothetical protein BpHYR1_042439 [Brachionus plicatilis]|uniref:Uncharacterized protein n=1 Tax=Brachionus plicatilis TaxID=10195 RepID=A0A3M7QX21_BRAPC|nr:hypothetical protein BpHYR1_042439 [Brachionus plicatilis]